jgi:hypothetical protein
MLPNNTTFDVYRGYAPATPYNPPNRPAVLAGLQGYLHQHVRNGRFGYYPSWAQSPFYWTTVLDVKVGTDARDAYDSQLNSDTIQNGDTVMVHDYPIPGTCCAFVVSFVQRRNRGTPADFLRLYLDRAQPDWQQGCPDPATAGGGGSGVSACGCTDVPTTLYLTLRNASKSACNCLEGTYTLSYSAANGDWRYTGDACSVPALFRLYCQDNIWTLNIGTNINWNQVEASSVQCSPFQASFPVVTVVADLCTSGSGEITITPSVSQ